MSIRVDLTKHTVRINKAWKRDGEDGEQDVPPWLKRLVRSKHAMRGHYLGNPNSSRGSAPLPSRVNPLAPKVLRSIVRGSIAQLVSGLADRLFAGQLQATLPR